RRVRDQDRGAPRRRADLLEHVEVLRHEHEVHDVLRRRARHRALELVDRVAQTGDDGLALIGDAATLERLALRVTLRDLDLEDALGLALFVRRDAHALGRVDLVHRLLYARIGLDVGDERLDDAV